MVEESKTLLGDLYLKLSEDIKGVKHAAIIDHSDKSKFKFTLKTTNN